MVDRIFEKGYSANMIMYKAVRITDDGKLVSAFDLPTKMVVEYKVGEWAYPNKEIITLCEDYGIFVSKSPEVLHRITACTLDTSGFLNDGCGDTYAVYECEVQYPERDYRPFTYYFFDDGAVPNLFADTFQNLPVDTAIVKACKLTRQLTYEDLKHYYKK